MTRLLTMLLVVASLGLSACAPVVVGGVVTGGYLASQERGAKNAVWDLKIKTHVMERLTNANYKNIARIGVYVLQGDVLLTGIVQTQDEFDKIGDLARNMGVKAGELIPGAVPARCDQRGFLLIGDPPELGPYVLPGNNYHVYDIPLFWANIRADALWRIEKFLAR